ncbi:anti-sigma factor family protein [Arhodomonas sp. SL1]|uniref:anti-sigma factor family protein n=1 Tax=Arhodomonas sp. SL1 TaxID=3425691 RepID=UPI003F881798
MSGDRVTCEEVIRQLFAYLDRELDAATRAELDHHMDTCRECFSRAEFERRLRERVREATAEEAPERLHRRVQDILERF